MTSTRFDLRPAAVGLLCAAAVLAWWALKVYSSHGGNWTALFMTGSAGPPPEALRFENVYVFPHGGYDSQFYHYMAHDPFLRREFRKSFDAPRLRWRRIFVPACAWILACGHDRWIDPAYYSVTLAMFFLGAWWMARYLVMNGLPAWGGIAFLLLPSSLIILDRLVIDFALTSLCMGYLVYTREKAAGKLWLVLAAAILTRETGLALLAAWLVVLLGRREFQRALLYATAGIPAVAWFVYVASRTESVTLEGWGWTYPLGRIIEAIQWSVTHLPAAPLDRFAIALDVLALAGSAFAVLAGLSSFRRVLDPAEAATAAFALFGLILTAVAAVEGFTDIFGHARHLGALTALLACSGFARRRWVYLAPAASHALRIGLTLGVGAAAAGRALLAR